MFIIYINIYDITISTGSKGLLQKNSEHNLLTKSYLQCTKSNTLTENLTLNFEDKQQTLTLKEYVQILLFLCEIKEGKNAYREIK